MEIKKHIKARSLKFNFELNKNVFGNCLFIQKNDIEKSILSINILSGSCPCLPAISYSKLLSGKESSYGRKYNLFVV